MREIREMLEDGKITKKDVNCLKEYAIEEFNNPNTDLEEESSMWMSIGMMVLWLGWFFFNGGSAYTLFNPSINPSKIIMNTILSAGAGGACAYFLKKPIHLWYMQCFQQKGQFYKTFRASQRFDSGSICNGLLAGLVAITAGCDVVDQWAAVCIGIIGGLLYSFFSKMINALNIDDPLEAASVHYANGVWGILSCFVFDTNKGFVSGNRQEMGAYVGVQIYGIIAVTLWAIAMSFTYFKICECLGYIRYHPLYEFVGAHRL